MVFGSLRKRNLTALDSDINLPSWWVFTKVRKFVLQLLKSPQTILKALEVIFSSSETHQKESGCQSILALILQSFVSHLCFILHLLNQNQINLSVRLFQLRTRLTVAKFYFTRVDEVDFNVIRKNEKCWGSCVFVTNPYFIITIPKSLATLSQRAE